MLYQYFECPFEGETFQFPLNFLEHYSLSHLAPHELCVAIGRMLHRNPQGDRGNMLAFNDIGEVQVTEDLVSVKPYS